MSAFFDGGTGRDVQEAPRGWAFLMPKNRLVAAFVRWQVFFDLDFGHLALPIDCPLWARKTLAEWS
ncbi:MAG TPA: hypothetical protein VIN35_08215 [Hydrogenophaga sp.]